MFGAKEATAKCWYPLTGQWPERHDLTITALAVTGAATGSFHVRLAAGGRDLAGSGRELVGRWLARDGLILSAVAVSAI